MPTDSIRVVQSFPVGRYQCELTIAWQPHGSADMKAEWSPDVPPLRSLNANEVEQYQAGRNRAIAEFAREAGISVMVVDP